MPCYALAIQCSWTGAVDDKWSVDGNWSCGVVPDVGDTVIINNATVVLDTSVEIKHFELLGTGQLNGSKNLVINGDLIWNGNGGIGDGSGGMITVTGSATLDGNSKSITGKSLFFNGGGEYLSGNITLDQNSKIELASDQVFYLRTTTNTIFFMFNNSVIINHGTVNRISNTAGLLTIVQFINNDTLLVNGPLQLSNVTMNNAAVQIDANQFLRVSQSNFTNSKFAEGAINVISGTCEINAGTSIDSRIFVNGTLSNNISLPLNKAFHLGPGAGAVYKANSGSHLILNSKSSWNGTSVISGEGQITVNDTLEITGLNNSILATELELNHVVIWTGSLIRFENNALITNKGSFVAESTDNAIFSLTNSSPAFTNEGQFIKSGTNTLTIEVDFVNDGTLKGTGLIDFVTGRLSGNGAISPGLSPGHLRIDENIDLDGSLNIEIISTAGAGMGHDLLEVSGMIDIIDANINLVAADSVPETSYTILQCADSSPNCIQGTFLTTNLAPNFTLVYTPDSIQAVKVPCTDSLDVNAALLANDPHPFYFFASNLITSDGIVTNQERLIFDAGESTELSAGFEVQSGSELIILVDGCAEL